METSATIFFHEADIVMQRFNETDYFSIHNALDEEHGKLGLELLEDLPSRKYEKLLEVQDQGWNMVNTACDRIAVLTWPKIEVTTPQV